MQKWSTNDKNQFTVTGVQTHRNRNYFQFNNAHDCNIHVGETSGHLFVGPDFEYHQTVVVLAQVQEFLYAIQIKPRKLKPPEV